MKSFILPFWSLKKKHQKGPVGQSVSSNFVDNVANSQMHQYIAFLNLNLPLFSEDQAFI